MRTKEEIEVLQAQMEEVMADKAFAEKLVSLKELEDVKKELEDKGVDLTVDEIKQIIETLGNEEEVDGELSDDELEEAAGGFGIGVSSGRCLERFFNRRFSGYIP